MLECSRFWIPTNPPGFIVLACAVLLCVGYACHAVRHGGWARALALLWLAQIGGGVATALWGQVLPLAVVTLLHLIAVWWALRYEEDTTPDVCALSDEELRVLIRESRLNANSAGAELTRRHLKND